MAIGFRVAERIKFKLGSAAPLDHPECMKIMGRDLQEGIPRSIVINDQEIREALEPDVKAIIEAVKEVLELCSSELAADIVHNGIAFTGGGSLIKKIEERVKEETKLKVFVVNNPTTAVIDGLAKVMNNKKLWTYIRAKI